MDWLTDGINSIIETLKSWIMTALEYTVFAALYYIEVALAWILSLIENLLEIFTGEKDVLYSGNSTALVNVFFNHSSVRTIYTAIGLIGIVFAFAFAIVAVVRKILDLRGKQQGVTLGTILGNLLKSILLIGSMNVIVLVALTTTNILVEQVSYSFTHVHQLAEKKEKGEDLSLDRMLIMIGTMGSINGVAAARNDTFNKSPSLYDNVRLPFYTGEKSIYDYSEILDVFYTDPYHMNYLVVYVAAFGLIMEMVVLVLNCAVRIFNLVALYVIAPLTISAMPLDDGGKFKQWTTAFTIQLLSVVGTVISIRLFFIFLPIIWSPELTIGGNALVDGFVKCIMMYASITAVNKINGIFTGILADNAGYQAVMAGDMKQEFEGSALGRVLGKATGSMKSFGLDKLADRMERGGSGGGGGGEKKEGGGERKQPDPKKAQAANEKQAAQNRKDYNKLKADFAHAQKTGHHATGSGKKLKAGELDKMGKTLKHMEQGYSKKDAAKMAEGDMKWEKQQQKQADAAEKRKNQTPPPDRERAKKAAGKMNQNDYERMKSDYNYAKENGTHLTNDKRLKNGELDQMKETLDQYESMHGGQGGTDGSQADSGAGSGAVPQSESNAGVESSGGSSESSASGAGSGKDAGSGAVPQNESNAGVQGSQR